MDCVLCLPGSDSNSGDPIDESIYTKYKRASDVLLHCLFIEIKYDILTSNYLDLEKQILYETESRMVRGYDGYPATRALTIALNKCILNLLTSARMYTDQIVGHVRRCLPDQSNKRNCIKKLICDKRTNSWDFRFLELLRNYAQHSGLSVHWTSYRMKAKETNERMLSECTLDYAVEPKWFDEDTVNKLRMDRNGLSIIASDRIHLKQPIRRYMDSLRDIHTHVRELIEDNVNESRCLIQSTLSNYTIKWNREISCLEARKINDTGSELEKALLMLDWDCERIKLQKRNSSSKRLERGYVTNSSSDSD